MKQVIAGIVAALVIGIGGYFLLVPGSSAPGTDQEGSNVVMEDGRQIVRIKAKGGYWPVQSVAKAGVPTTLRFETGSTFDCSSVLRIPSLDITKNLPPSGETDIDVGTLEPGTLQGSCGMGMYRFAVVAE